MTTLRFMTTIILAALVSAHTALAQSNPNTERGMTPSKSYQVGEVDTINTFNGTLNVRVPIGGTYPVSPTLSYGLALHYATGAWEIGEHTEVWYYETHPYTEITNYAYPASYLNAGFGWILTLGRLVDLPHVGLVYLSPDGAQHPFAGPLHPNNPANEPIETGVSYTHDGTYLRLRVIAGGRELDFPDGTVHRFDNAGLLQEMRDRYGSKVEIHYETRGTEAYPGSPSYAGSTRWRISDTHGRQHYVYFRPGYSYVELNEANVAHEVVDYIDMAAFDSARALYKLDYDAAPSAPPLKRRCVGSEYLPIQSTNVNVNMLTAVRMPESLRYDMKYDMGFSVNCPASVVSVGPSGSMTELRLPTGGKIQWQHQDYSFPGTDDSNMAQIVGYNTGVANRKVLDVDGRLLSNTDYIQENLSTSFPQRETRRVVRHWNESDYFDVRHYFATCKLFGCSYWGHYGLPVSPVRPSSDGLGFLSTETVKRDGTVLRSTYLAYEGDGNMIGDFPNGDGKSPRVRFQRTVYEDGRTSDVTYSNFDGLGHYRTVQTGGTFEKGNVRKTFTNYNPTRADFNMTSPGVLLNPWYPLPSTSPWILNTFDVARVSEVDERTGLEVHATSRCCFDANGFLTSRRIYQGFGLNPTAAGTDLLDLYTRDALGFLVKEQSFGGDVWAQRPETGIPAPTNFNCQDSLTGEAFRIDYSYLYGSLRTSYYSDSAGSPLSFFLADNEIDFNTGLPRYSWTASTHGAGSASNHDGLRVEFKYDGVGRPTEVKRTGSTRGRSRFQYGVDPAGYPIVDLYEDAATGSILSHRKARLDALGRVIREERDMPPNAVATRLTEYNSFGWVKQTSEWGNGLDPKYTRIAYDTFGRPVSFIAPDNTETTTEYTGSSEIRRKSYVRTGGTADTLTTQLATTTEKYDRQGRLWKVTEPSNISTEYFYDVGGRLAEVCMNRTSGVCGQVRKFNYDNRGFLTSEQHPEIGVSGGGTVQYPHYDARGHLLQRIVGAANGPGDLSYRYDRAERMTRAHETRAGERNLKVFEYATSNPGSDFRNGRLTRAVRHNWFDEFAYDEQIVEDYKYDNRDGRTRSRATSHYRCIPGQSDCNVTASGLLYRKFEQEFEYDDAGLMTSLTYPACTSGLCTGVGGARTVTNSYNSGLLTNVSSNGQSMGVISYHLNGLVNQVIHGNGVVDTQTIDPANGMARPLTISTANSVDPGSCVKPTFSQQPASQTKPAGLVTLQAAAAGENGQTVSYQWYRGTGTGDPVGTNSGTLQITVSQTTQFWVRASNSCGSKDSAVATITTCLAPTVTQGPPWETTIYRGQSTTLSVSASGDQPLRFQWYTTDFYGQMTAVPGLTTATVEVSPTTTTTYRVRVTNDCGSDTSDYSHVIVEPPPAPPTLVAVQALSIGSIQVIWAPPDVQAIGQYVVERAEDGQPFHPIATVPASSGYMNIMDAGGLASYTAYRYRVKHVISGASSQYSATDIAVTVVFADPDLAAVGWIKRIHIGELRQSIDAVRRHAGLPQQWNPWNPPVGSYILAAHVEEMRVKLNEALRVMNLPEIEFTDLVVVHAPVKRSPLEQLRTALRGF